MSIILLFSSLTLEAINKIATILTKLLNIQKDMATFIKQSKTIFRMTVGITKRSQCQLLKTRIFLYKETELI